MNTLNRDPGHATAPNARHLLAGLLLNSETDLATRFVRAYQTLASRPRAWRRRLQHKLSATLAGAALLLALAAPTLLLQPPAHADGNAAAAVIVVVNGEVADVTNGKCGLIEAIINARATKAGQMRPDCTAGNVSGQDTVSLPTNGSFTLTDDHNRVYGQTGLPVITTAVVIEGNGTTIRRSTADETPYFRILAIDDVGRLTLRNVIVRDGLSIQGAGVLNRNILTAEGVTFLDNNSEGPGGGVYAGAGTTTTISGSAFVGNQVTGWYYGGGGLAIAGTATLANTTITDNSGSYGGGLSVHHAGSLTISESLIADNAVSAERGGVGGGINVGGTGNVTIIDSTIADNNAAGDMYGGYGGGVFVGWDAQVTISGSTIVGNRATSGGQYDPFAPWVGPGFGGGLFVWGTADISNSTISGNEANRGGGVLNGGALTLTHATISGNHGLREVDTYDGYELAPGFGGGIYSSRNVCGTTKLVGTIVSGNTADDGAPEILINDVDNCIHVIVADAHNVFGHDGNSGLVGMTPGANDIIPTVALSAILGPLGDNGGSTQTHALPAGSPAIDIAPNATCAAAPINGIDQRGRPRNMNGAGPATDHDCDAGSFEAPMPPILVPFIISAGGSGSVGGVAFTPADLIKYDPAAGWSMVFDASDYGISQNLTAFEIMDNGDILMTFAARLTITGLGTATPFDVVRFRPSTGAFSWYFRGKVNRLTTWEERIDALGLTNDGRLAISTTGTATVWHPGYWLRVHDEDVLGFDLAQRKWSLFFSGSAPPSLRSEDVNGLWVDKGTNDLYMSILGPFNLGGVQGNGKDIVRMAQGDAGGYYKLSLWWDGSAAGFPSTIDGLEILR